MKDFDRKWTRAEAIHALFFSDPSVHPVSVDEKRMHQLICMAFEGLPLQSSALSPLQQQTLRQAVEAVEMSMPHLTATCAVHSILWSRWALRSSGLSIANTFWIRFAQWRATKRPSFVRLMQYRLPGSRPWRGRARTTKGTEKLVGYTIDQVLSEEDFPFEEYVAQWRVKPVRFTAVVERSAGPRAVETVCGQETMRVLGECIRTEARRGGGPTSLLSSKMNKGKYACTVSQAELLERLKSQHPALTRYSDSTLTRGLSAFVRCPRGRPGGYRRPKQ